MVKMSARVLNRQGSHSVTLKTGGSEHSITIPPKTSGAGSSANGAELLFLALATCYCNDIYREAQQRNITVKSVQVEVEGDYDGVPGHPMENVIYHATVEADAPEEAILELMRQTDRVAEIQNTLRQGIQVTLGRMKAVST
ncbi:MAG: OsmC family protein [Anaerolineae bacterium]|nr:OsmC family protein [Anaerolineae bacterium]